MRRVSVCTNCGKRAIFDNDDVVEVTINAVLQKCTYMVCKCDNCDERYIVEVQEK